MGRGLTPGAGLGMFSGRSLQDRSLLSLIPSGGGLLPCSPHTVRQSGLFLLWLKDGKQAQRVAAGRWRAWHSGPGWLSLVTCGSLCFS